MLNFTDLMFQAFDTTSSEEEKKELNRQLKEIYGEDCRNYQEKNSDFEVCKTQLLKLLDRIYELNNDSLVLFHEFHQNISKLNKDSGDENINVVLQSTKHSLESSFPALIEHSANLDGNPFKHLTVNACIQGACANIEQALGSFKINELSLLISHAKAECLRQLAKAFLDEHGLCEYAASSEIHYISSLYNNLSENYGLSKIDDSYCPELTDAQQNLWEEYVIRHFSVAYFLQYCHAFFPQPPNQDIKDRKSSEQLKDFFHLFKQECVEDNYLKLYDEQDNEDGIALLKPKPEPQFLFYYRCLLADYLQKNGFIDGLHLTFKDTNYLYNGEQLVKITGELLTPYQVVSSQELRVLMNEPDFKDMTFYNQLEPNDLKELCLQYPDHPDYFHILLNQDDLSDATILALWDVIDDNKQSLLAFYVFCHPHNTLTGAQLMSMCAKIPQNKMKQLMEISVRDDKPDYLWCLMIYNTKPSLRKRLPFEAAETGATKIMSLLFKLGVPLDIKDNYGKTPAHIAAKKGRVELITKLAELGVPLDVKDDYDKTPAHIAAKKGNVELITKLAELGVPLDVKDNYGQTLAHYAVYYGYVELIIKLAELDVPLDVKDNDGLTPAHLAAYKGDVELIIKLADLGVPLDVKNNFGETPAHIAAVKGDVGLIIKLAELGVPLDIKNKNGLTPAQYAKKYNNKYAVKTLQDLGHYTSWAIKITDNTLKNIYPFFSKQSPHSYHSPTIMALSSTNHMFFKPYDNLKDASLTLLATASAPLLWATATAFFTAMYMGAIILSPVILIGAVVGYCRQTDEDSNPTFYDFELVKKLSISLLLCPIMTCLSIPIALLRAVTRTCATLMTMASTHCNDSHHDSDIGLAVADQPQQ